MVAQSRYFLLEWIHTQIRVGSPLLVSAGSLAAALWAVKLFTHISEVTDDTPRPKEPSFPASWLASLVFKEAAPNLITPHHASLQSVRVSLCLPSF